MGKLSLVIALAMVLVGCGGTVEGPEEFAFVTAHSGLYLRTTPVADEINAEDPTVLVTVELLSLAATDAELRQVNMDAYVTGTDRWNLERVDFADIPGTKAVLMIGDEATPEAIKAGMLEWIDAFSKRRQPAE